MISVDEITKAFTDAGYPTRASAAPVGGKISLNEIKKAFADYGYGTSGSAAPPAGSVTLDANKILNLQDKKILNTPTKWGSSPTANITKSVSIPATKGSFAMGPKFMGALRSIRDSAKPVAWSQLPSAAKAAGPAIPLFALLDVATELTDEQEPFQKNLAQGLGSVGGSLGGAAAGATIAGLPGAIIGALLMSPVGKQLASGAYRVVNPRGQDEYDLKQIERQGEQLLARDAVMRQLANKRAQDQQAVNEEAALMNYLLR